jgi:hypothetical protein
LITCGFSALQPDAPRPLLTGPLCPVTIYGSPVTLPKFQMAPRLTFLIFSGSNKKKPRYTCLSEAKASQLQRIWAEVSFCAPHFLHNGLSIRPIKWRCLLRVLCPVRRPVTALDCILLKDKSLALVPRQGPGINSRACFWVMPRLCHCPQCCFTNQQLILFLRSCLETPETGSGPTNLEAEPSLETPLAISLPLDPTKPCSWCHRL